MDVCPASDLISQPWGDTNYTGEWAAGWAAGGHFHAGIDLGHSEGGGRLCGSPVYATRPGVIVAMNDPNRYLGDSAVCLHADEGVFIELGHLNSHVVNPGQRVGPGDLLGYVGTKGASTACHLHIEVRSDGANQAVNPSQRDTRILDPTPWLTSQGDDMQLTDQEVESAIRCAFIAAIGDEPTPDQLSAYMAAIKRDGSNINTALMGVYDSEAAKEWRRHLHAAKEG